MLNSLWERDNSLANLEMKRMKQWTPKQLLALMLVLTVGQALAAAPTVGLVMAKSTVRIDSQAVTGNSSILSGNVVESVGGISELRLSGGAVVMDTNAKVQVFENRTELQSGKIQVSGSSMSTGAGELKIQADAGSEAILERTNSSIIVGSLRGSVKVTNREGVLLASLNPGHAISLEPEPGDQGGAGTGKASDTSTTTTSKKKGGGFIIGAKTGIVLGTVTAVAVPVAVVANRSNKPTVSR